jgi:hypothetical protein
MAAEKESVTDRGRKFTEPSSSGQDGVRVVAGFRLYPEGSHAGDVVAVAEPPVSGRNRKMFVGRIALDGAVEILAPSQVLELKEAAEFLEQDYPRCKELLWLFKIIREGLRRRRAHRDIKDDNLPLALIQGHKSGSPLGESYQSAHGRKRSMQEAAKLKVPTNERLDDLCWNSMFEAPGSRIDFEDPLMRDFICRLHDCLGQFEDKYKAQGFSAEDRLPADLETLRRDGFRFIGIEDPGDGQRLFGQLIRDAVQLTSRIAGLTALRIIMDRVQPGLSQAETDMINLAYGTLRELAGVNRDLFGRRSSTVDPILAELYQLLAQGAAKTALDAKRDELARIFYLSSIYHGLRKEARRDTKRQARKIKRNVAEFSENQQSPSSSEELPSISERTAASQEITPLTIRTWITKPEYRETLELIARQVRLQKRTRLISDALMRTRWDVAEAAKLLKCKEKKIRDAVRHTLHPKMIKLACKLREDGEV